MGTPVIQLAISRTHTFVPAPDKQNTRENSQTQLIHANSKDNETMHLNGEIGGAPVNGLGGTVQQNGEVPVPQVNGPNRVIQVMNEPVVLRSKQLRPVQRGMYM